MKVKLVKTLIGHNLKLIRSEHKLTQKEFSKKSGISLRLIQHIESGQGNPSFETLFKISSTFEVSARKLLELHRITPSIPLEEFNATLKAQFESSSISVGHRQSNRVLWMNKRFSNMMNIEENPPEFLIENVYSSEMSDLMKMQLFEEKKGNANSYTLAFAKKNSNRKLYVRYHPIIIMNPKAKKYSSTLVYATPLEEDSDQNYYTFVSTVLKNI